MKKYFDRFAFDYVNQREENVKSKFQLFYAINDNKRSRIISDNFLAGFSL